MRDIFYGGAVDEVLPVSPEKIAGYHFFQLFERMVEIIVLLVEREELGRFVRQIEEGDVLDLHRGDLFFVIDQHAALFASFGVFEELAHAAIGREDFCEFLFQVPVSFQRAGDGFCGKGFEDVVDASRAEGLECVFVISSAEDDGGGIFDGVEQLEAKPIAQLYIAKNEIWDVAFFEPGPGFFYRRQGGHDIGLGFGLFYTAGQVAGGVLFVLNDHYFHIQGLLY